MPPNPAEDEANPFPRRYRFQKHKGPCQRSGCHRSTMRVSTDSGRDWSRYCKKHTCGLGAQCGRRKGSDGVYCDKHSICLTEDCYEKPPKDEATFPWYCTDHKCHWQSCTNEVDHNNNNFCTKHWNYAIQLVEAIRQRRPCQNCAASSQCRDPTCKRSCLQGSAYCGLHVCHIPDCGRGRMVERTHCHHHWLCLAEGCTSFRVVTDGQPNNFCYQHGLCGESGCRSPIESKYCFCKRHRCQKPKCHSRRDTWWNQANRWCQEHTCGVIGCDLHTDNNDTTSRFRYCKAHTCQHPECWDKTHHRGALCKLHLDLAAAPDQNRNREAQIAYHDNEDYDSEPQLPYRAQGAWRWVFG